MLFFFNRVGEDTKPFENGFIYKILNPGSGKRLFAGDRPDEETRRGKEILAGSKVKKRSQI